MRGITEGKVDDTSLVWRGIGLVWGLSGRLAVGDFAMAGGGVNGGV